MSDSLLKVVSGDVEATGKEVDPPQTPEQLLSRLHELGVSMRSIIVDAKRLPKTHALEAHMDQGRALAIAQSHLQTGWMWMRRAIKPGNEF